GAENALRGAVKENLPINRKRIELNKKLLVKNNSGPCAACRSRTQQFAEANCWALKGLISMKINEYNCKKWICFFA
ncbi:hypothetical protein, partial [Planococcus sp. CAU13]|uniref:hypothetical protein n=1 Tax=Planococcus sp. CAU13 TaxID=1541197 RepID=UPI0005300026